MISCVFLLCRLHTDAIPWAVLEYIHLNETETTSSSRIFIKILFQVRTHTQNLHLFQQTCMHVWG